jgi:glycosyltransferase involved in cell wall biosynthesis
MSTTDSPLVSVCTPTYNRPAFLAQLIDSIRAQDYSNWEMFIADNSSNDETEAVVAARADPRIRYERNATNIGMGRNTLKVLSQVRGKYFTFTPDDDLWGHDNLQRKVAFLEAHPDLPAIFSNANRIAYDGQPLPRFRSRYSDTVERMSASVLRPAAAGSEYFVNILTGLLRTEAALELFRLSWHMNTEEMFMWYLGLSGGEIGFDGAPSVTLREAEHYRVVEHKGSLIDFKNRADYRQRQLVDFYRVLHVQCPTVREALERADVQAYVASAIVGCSRSYRDLARALALVAGTFGAAALRGTLPRAIGKAVRIVLPFSRRTLHAPSGLGPVEEPRRT